MASAFSLEDTRAFLRAQQLDGWLLHDFHRNNPILWMVVGGEHHTSRRAFLFIPAHGTPRLLLHFLDVGRLADLGWPTTMYRSRDELVAGLRALLAGSRRVAMEYSEDCALPVVSRTDAGTIEQVRKLGVAVVSSGDVLQHAVARWSPSQLDSHRQAARAVDAIVREAFDFVGEELGNGVHELAVQEFIRRRYADFGVESAGGPDVAVNHHSGDPHYGATAESSARIHPGDWVVIDLWAKLPVPGAIFADLTWVGYVGRQAPPLHRRVFESVKRGRDEVLALLTSAHQSGRVLEGWEVDRAARDSIAADGYADYFTHRLGHSLGELGHSSGVNLDDYETHDTRQIIPGVGFSVEPGIYLPEFGVRLEVDVYVDPQAGPQITSPLQDEIVWIGL
jgi:Xaa-Pro dipeptidase